MMLILNRKTSTDLQKRVLTESIAISDVFSLTEGPFKELDSDELRQQLEPYLLRTVKTRHWFCSYVPAGYEKKVNLYRSCEETKQILIQSYHRLLGESPEPTTNLENICFFRDGKLFLGTVSHEYMCYAYPPDNKFYDILMNICPWGLVDDALDEQIIL